MYTCTKLYTQPDDEYLVTIIYIFSMVSMNKKLTPSVQMILQRRDIEDAGHPTLVKCLLVNVLSPSPPLVVALPV